MYAAARESKEGRVVTQQEQLIYWTASQIFAETLPKDVKNQLPEHFDCPDSEFTKIVSAHAKCAIKLAQIFSVEFEQGLKNKEKVEEQHTDKLAAAVQSCSDDALRTVKKKK